MRITIDARFYGLENAGLGRYTINLLHELEKVDTKNSYSVLLREKYFAKLKLQKNFTKILAEIPHYSVAEQLKLARLITSTNPDITHFLHFNIPLSYQEKFIVTIHDLLMHKSTGRDTTTLPMFLYHFKRVGYKAVFRHAVKASNHILVPSSFVKTELVDTYKINEKKVSVIYEGINKAILSTKSKEKILSKYKINSPFFIYTGNAYPHKNLKRAIEAIVFLNKESKEKIKFVIVCSRSVFTKRLEMLISKLQAKSFVEFVGFVPDDELQILYKNSLGFLYPSLSEGFGLPALEAMKSGTLALVSNIPVFKEIYADNAIYFEPYNTISIKKAMLKVLNIDHKKRESLIKNGQKYTLKYSWQKMAKETLKVYNSVK